GIILMDDVQGNVLGGQQKFIGGMFEHHPYPVPGLDLIVLFDRAAVDLDMAVLGGLLYFVAGSVFDEVHQVLVHAKGLLALGPDKAIVLNKLLFLGEIPGLDIFNVLHISWIRPVSLRHPGWYRCHRSTPPWRSLAVYPPVLHTCP